MNMHSSVEEQA